MKGDDVEESQFRVSATIAGEDEYVEFWPAGTLAKGQFACNCLRESRHRPQCAAALHGLRRAALGTGRLESLRAVLGAGLDAVALGTQCRVSHTRGRHQLIQARAVLGGYFCRPERHKPLVYRN